MPGSLGHCLVNDPADRLADHWIQIADGGRDMAANGLGGVHFGLASEWLAAGQRFVADYRQREDVGSRRAGLHLDLLRRHVLEGTLQPCDGFGPNQMNDTEVDDLHRIVVHDEDVAGLEVTVNHPSFVGRLKTTADLRDY